MHNPPPVLLDTPKLLSAKEKSTLAVHWGKNPLAQRLEKKYSTDLLLLYAIHEIRDGYYQLFAERRFLLKQQKKYPDDIQIEAKLEDIQFDLVLHNNKSFKRFQYPGYGVPVAIQKQLYNGQDRPAYTGDPLDVIAAKKIMGPIIGAAIDCFQGLDSLTLPFLRTPRMQVPAQASLMAKPSMLNLKRNQPRSSWVSEFESKGTGGKRAR